MSMETIFKEFFLNLANLQNYNFTGNTNVRLLDVVQSLPLRGVILNFINLVKIRC